MNGELLMEKKIKLVFPGEFLTVEEEYLPGTNTFEEKNGRIYSARIGELEFNEKEREVTVKPKKERKLLDAGTIITGSVLLVKDSMALIKIIKAEKDNEERIPLNNTAILFISNMYFTSGHSMYIFCQLRLLNSRIAKKKNNSKFRFTFFEIPKKDLR